jgi:hypothetical protein
LTPRLRWRHGVAGLPSETVVGLDHYDGHVDARYSSAPGQWAEQTSTAVYLQNSTTLAGAWTATLGGRSQRMEQRAHQDAYAAWFTPALDGEGARSRQAVGLHRDFAAGARFLVGRNAAHGADRPFAVRAEQEHVVRAPVRARVVIPVQIVPGLIAALQEQYHSFNETYANVGWSKGPVH